MKQVAQAEHVVQRFIVKEWKSPGMRAAEQLALGWLCTTFGTGAAVAVQLTSTSDTNFSMIFIAAFTAAVLSLAYCIKEYLAAHGDKIAQQSQLPTFNPAHVDLDLAETVRTDILPFVRQELSGHADQISQKIQSALYQMWQSSQQPTPRPSSVPAQPILSPRPSITANAAAAALIEATPTQSVPTAPSARLPLTPAPVLGTVNLGTVNLSEWPTGIVPVAQAQR